MRRVQLFLLLLVLSCTPKAPSPSPVVYDYLPLKTGAFFVYSVDSTVIDQNISQTYLYDLLVQVTDSFPNADGGYTYVMLRSKRDTTGSAWTALESWSARVSAYQAVVSEGNIPYVKMAGPLEDGKAWDGNALNTLGGTEKCPGQQTYTCDIYTISLFGKPYQTFSNSLTVIQNDNEDLIVAQDVRSEVYVKAVGLVDRSIVQLNYATDEDHLGTQFVATGLQYHQSLTQYGGL